MCDTTNLYISGVLSQAHRMAVTLLNRTLEVPSSSLSRVTVYNGHFVVFHRISRRMRFYFQLATIVIFQMSLHTGQFSDLIWWYYYF